MYMETSRRRIVQRLLREGWELVREGKHSIYAHPRKGIIVVPRHGELRPGTARTIAQKAGWE